MKLINNIKTHRKLRLQQEDISKRLVLCSQDIWNKEDSNPYLTQLQEINKLVYETESKLPFIYFLVCDIFCLNQHRKIVENRNNIEIDFWRNRYIKTIKR